MNRLLSLGALALVATAVLADEPLPAPEAPVLDPVTVTATRVGTGTFVVPASVSVQTAPAVGLGVNLSDWLPTVPGLLARDRQNYAQDTQISIRGFGSRATFGIRGVRLLLDGIPATQPDGQGQVSHFNLDTADRVEVLRGPFSALYGNSSGGVIQLFTADGGDTPEWRAGAAYGRDRTQRESAGYAGPVAGMDTLRVNIGYTHFETEGYRDHSAAQRDSLNGKLRVDLGGAGTLSLVANYFNLPEAQDPLGLTRDQVSQNRRQAPVAEQFNTRKNVEQSQLGLIYEFSAGAAGHLQATVYGGQRSVLQFLALTPGAQAPAKSSGGVVDLGNVYSGTDARWVYEGHLLDGPLTLVGGVSADTLRQHRRGFNNFVGTTSGVEGALRRDEINTVNSLDEYAQAEWRFHPRGAVFLGLRHSTVDFRSDDRFITATNPNDSGRTNDQATLPVVGLQGWITPDAQTYVSYGSGFETPTFAELAYRPDGSAGLNFALQPARSRNLEWGAKWRLRPGTRLEAAVFETDTNHELVTVTNSGGRATFGNAGRTRRRGVELSISARLHPTLTGELAWTALDASVREDYRTCPGSPCSATQTVVVRRGNAIPGIARGQATARLLWNPAPDWQTFVQLRAVDAVPVNDQNTEAAPSYTVFDLGLVRQFQWVRQTLRAGLRLDNALGERVIGSVIVNDGNGRYYEPAPGRSALASLEWHFRAN